MAVAEKIGRFALPARPVKIAFIYGLRAEAVKLAPVIKDLQSRPLYFSPILINTGQQKDAGNILDLFGVKNTGHRLKISGKVRKRESYMAELLANIGRVLTLEKPDYIIIQGDSETAFAAALSAHFHKLPVGHVEAGLRTYDLNSPFPQEAFKPLITRISTLHFAPTEVARRNLLKEHVNSSNILITGNPVIDAAKNVRHNVAIMPDSRIIFSLPQDKKMILFNYSRNENYGESLKNVLDAVKTFAVNHKEAVIVFPVGEDSTVTKVARSTLGGIDNIKLLDLVDYPTMLYLIDKSYFVMTDSGSIIEEASYFRKPVLILRDKTDRIESVNAGIAKLTGVGESGAIAKMAEQLLTDRQEYEKMARAARPELYGDGSTSGRITAALMGALGFPLQNRVDIRKRMGKSKEAAVGWLLHSGIQATIGGFYGYYHITGKENIPGVAGNKTSGEYPFIYPEITGYGMTTLLELYKKSGNKRLLESAKKAADWVIAALEKVGEGAALPARIYHDQGARPYRHSFYYTYDNGILLKGLVNTYKATKDERYLNAAKQVARFLTDVMKVGKREFFSYYDPRKAQPLNTPENWAMNSGSYHANISPGFLELHSVTGDKQYLDAAISLCNHALRYQERNGRFITSPIGNETHAHPHLYAAEGLRATALYLKQKKIRSIDSARFLSASINATRWILDNQLPNGGVRFQYKEEGFMPYERSDALAQALKVGSLLIGDGLLEKRYKQNLEALASRLISFQESNVQDGHVNGGFGYGQNESGAEVKDINTWCTMFALDAYNEYGEIL